MTVSDDVLAPARDGSEGAVAQALAAEVDALRAVDRTRALGVAPAAHHDAVRAHAAALRRAYRAEAALDAVRALTDRWSKEADRRGNDDQVYTRGVVGMISRAMAPAAEDLTFAEVALARPSAERIEARKRQLPRT